MKKTTAEVRNRIGALVSEAVQKGIMIAMSDDKEGQPGAINLACNTALSCLIPTVPLFVKKPAMTKEEANKNPTKFLGMINTETVMFAALITARMHGELVAKGPVEDINDEFGGVEVNGSVEFGPHVLAMALEDWKKVTGKKPEDYFRSDLLEAVAESERASTAPFDEFLQKRVAEQGNAPSSGTLQ